MHDLEPGFFTLGLLPIYSYTLRWTAEDFFVFPFGIPESRRYTPEVHESRLPVGFSSFHLLSEHVHPALSYWKFAR
jgi:hypothetical protein